MERDDVISSAGGRDGQHGVGVAQVGWFKGHFYGCFRSAAPSRSCGESLINMEVTVINLDEASRE